MFKFQWTASWHVGAAAENVVKIAPKIRPKRAIKAEILGSFFGGLDAFGQVFWSLYLKIRPQTRNKIIFGIHFRTFRVPGQKK